MEPERIAYTDRTGSPERNRAAPFSMRMRSLISASSLAMSSPGMPTGRHRLLNAQSEQRMSSGWTMSFRIALRRYLCRPGEDRREYGTDTVITGLDYSWIEFFFKIGRAHV